MTTELGTVRLVSAVELDLCEFATRERKLSEGSGRDLPAEWHRYWLDSLADSSVVGLTLIRPGSWHVAVGEFTDPGVLGRYVDAIVRRIGGPDALNDPDTHVTLSGGLALLSGDDVLIHPACCCDLDNISEWRQAAEFRGPEWKIVWVGHPRVSVRFEAGRLIVSQPHESDTPTARWSVEPEALGRAAADPEVEMKSFARKLRTALGDLGVENPGGVAERMAGLSG